MTRWQMILARIVRQSWFRAAIISLLGILLALAAAVAAPYIPYHFRSNLGQDAVGGILRIMASSMLAVTTFSLTAMVQAYSSATQLATPRATQLMISDPTSQNALSTFLGAFVFSIVGIITLSAGVYGDQGRIILFGGTVLLIAIVVATLLRWIAHITAFGRMADMIDRVERAATAAMRAFVADPYLGGRPAGQLPSAASAIMDERAGYVTHVDVRALSKIADARRLTVHVMAIPGTAMHPGRPFLRVEGAMADEDRLPLLQAFTVERHRSYDQDPRLGLIALSEVASRALSPAVNDPGTAIEVLGAITRVLLLLPADDPAASDVEHPRIYVPRPTRAAMLIDAFRPIQRAGASEIEVLIRTMKTLAALQEALPGRDANLSALIDETMRRGERGLEDDSDRAALAIVHARLR